MEYGNTLTPNAEKYVGETLRSMQYRDEKRPSSRRREEEYDFANAIAKNGNKVTYKFVCYEKSGATAKDKSMVKCIFNCINTLACPIYCSTQLKYIYLNTDVRIRMQC